MEEKKIWSMDELVALTDEVQINEVVFRGKLVEFQYCELTEKEEPKLPAITEDLPEDEKMGMYQELGSQRVLKMIQKANEKNPDGPVIVEEQWSLLPTTLRYAISNKILGAEDTAAVNFQN
jgi:hypothetical protein|tara:strand:- start:1210 stop:1572 length:363 start_codon:yes stop_codon:yes gene_type:complete